MVTNLGEFDTEGSYWYEPRGSVSSDKEVDLGLTITIGTKSYKVIFANANLTKVGLAEKASDFGDYFAWAATEPWVTYTYSNGSFSNITWKDGYDDGYSEANAPYYDRSNHSYEKYYGKNTLEAADDAANKILGGDWQIPTTEVWQALYSANNSTVYWGEGGNKALNTIDSSTIQGMKITKKDDPGTYIFLPAASYVSCITFDKVGSGGNYWSGTSNSSDMFAYFLKIKSGSVTEDGSYNRNAGFTVRPVRLVAE